MSQRLTPISSNISNSSDVSTNASTQLRSSSIVNVEELGHLDNYSIYIKVVFSVVNGFFIVFSVFALLALNKTKRTPPTAR